MKEKVKTFHSVSVIISFTGLSFVFSILLQVVFAYLYGAKSQMDAYFLALSIPLLVSGIFISTLAVVFIPLFREFIVKKEEAGLWELINTLTSYLAIALAGITVLLFIFSGQIISLAASSLLAQTQLEAASLLRILSLSILPMGLYSLLVVVYYSEDSFFRPVFARALSPLSMVVFVLLFNSFLGIKSPAYAFVFGSWIQFLAVLYFLLKEKAKFRFSLMLSKIKVKRVWQSASLVMAGILAFGYILPAEKFIAARLGGGSVSYFGYVERIFSILVLLPNMAIPTVILPQLAEHYAIDNMQKLRSTFSSGIRSTLFVTLPLVVFLFIFREVLIRVFLQRGAFDQSATVACALVLACYLGVFFESERLVILNTLYAMRDTLTPFITGAVCLLIYLLAAFPLSAKLSFAGLALAHSFACIAFSVINIIVLRFKLGTIDGLKIFTSALKMALAACGSGIAMLIIFNMLGSQGDNLLLFIKLIVSLFFGMISYLGLCFILRLSELKQFYGVLVSYKRKLFPQIAVAIEE